MTGIKGRRWGANVYVDTAIAVGSLFYVDSNHVLQPLAPGTSGDFLKTNGTGAAPSWGTPSGGGGGGGASGALVLLESHTASSSASLNFTTRNATGQSGNTIQADYDDYIVKFLDVVPASDGVNLLTRAILSGTPDSSSKYLWALTYGVASGIGGAGNDTVAQTAISVGTITNTANFTFSGSMELFGPRNSVHKSVTGHFRHRFSAGDARRIGTTLHASYENATAIDGLQFLMSSGNIASGTIRVYGVAK